MNSKRSRTRRRTTAAVAAAVLASGAAVASIAPAQAAPVIHATATHTSATKPTIVLIHGAFADASGFDSEITTLEHRGYTVYAPAVPLRGLKSDSQYIRSFLKTISGPIILAGHSYGGAVITNAARGVSNVKALVYLDAFLPAKGESAATAEDPVKYPGALLGPDVLTPRPFTNAAGEKDADLYITPSDFRAVFAGDVSAKRAAQEAATQRPLASSAFTEASGKPAWKTIPSWDLVGTKDRAIAPGRQLAMAKRAHSHITRVASAHDVMVSHPAAVVKILLKAVKAEG